MTSALPSPAREEDFADWVHPLLVKSLRQSLRSRMFIGVFLWTQVSLAWLVCLQVLIKDLEVRHVVHLWQWADAFIILAVMVPLWPVFVRDEDRRPESLDLIRLTPISTQRFAFGKWICALTQGLLLAVTMIPYGLVCHYLGRIEVAKEMEAFFWVLANMVVLSPWGILVGALPVAGRVALAPVLFFGLLFVFGGLMGILLANFSGVWCPWIPIAAIAWIVGYTLAGARFEMR